MDARYYQVEMGNNETVRNKEKIIKCQNTPKTQKGRPLPILQSLLTHTLICFQSQIIFS